MKKFKALLCLTLVTVLVFAFASPTLAAWKTYKVTARSASYHMIDATCNFGVAKKDWSNAVTVVNNGSVPVFFYIGSPSFGKYVKTINPGKEYTYRPYNLKSQRIQIYAQDDAPGKQSIIVKTTRGSITTTRAK